VQSQEIARTLNLNVDQLLVLRLQANPSTGYAWKLTAEPQLLRIEGKPAFEQNAAPANSTGVPGHEVWRFRATKPGNEMLRFEYRRAWEAAEAPAQIVTYHVNVH